MPFAKSAKVTPTYFGARIGALERIMLLPVTLNDFYKKILLETVRMSYPGSMTRGVNPPLVANGDFKVKATIENYFIRIFPIESVFCGAITDFDTWHQNQTISLGNYLKRYRLIGPGRNSRGVAAKFINTFMHQLMKYNEARYLWSHIHLPLDQKVFNQLRNVDSASLNKVESILCDSPYTLNYPRYYSVQNAICGWINELNSRENAYEITSRIQLNWLWSE